MELLIACLWLCKAAVIVGDEVWQKRFCRLDRADAGESQLLHQTILQRMVRALDATLRLAGIGTQNLDVKFRQRPSELGHSVTAGRILVRHTKDGMLVGVEGDGFAVAAKIGLQRLEIGKCALRCDKA